MTVRAVVGDGCVLLCEPEVGGSRGGGRAGGGGGGVIRLAGPRPDAPADGLASSVGVGGGRLQMPSTATLPIAVPFPVSLPRTRHKCSATHNREFWGSAQVDSAPGLRVVCGLPSGRGGGAMGGGGAAPPPPTETTPAGAPAAAADKTQ